MIIFTIKYSALSHISDILGFSKMRMSYKLILCVLVSVLMGSSGVYAQTYQTYKELGGSWYYYDDFQRHQSYDPSQKQEKLFLTLDRDFPEHAFLSFEVNSGTSLFIEDEILDQFTATTIVKYDLDSLFEASSHSKEFITILLYNRRYIKLSGTSVIFLKESDQGKSNEAKLRKSSNFKNTLLIFFFLVLCMLVYVKINHADIWRGYMNLGSLLSIKDSGDTIYKIRPFEKGALSMVLTYSMISATAIFGLSYLDGFRLIPLSLFSANNSFVLILNWLLLSVTFFTMAYFRYFLIKTFTRLFDFKGASRIHFYNHIKLLITLMITVVLVELVLIFGMQRLTFFSWFETIIVTLLIFKSILISLKLFRISSFRFFHLFSYLCATEIIPAIILVKITF